MAGATITVAMSQVQLDSWDGAGEPLEGIKGLVQRALSRAGLSYTSVEVTAGESAVFPELPTLLEGALAAAQVKVRWPGEDIGYQLGGALVSAGCTDECENNDVLVMWDLPGVPPIASYVMTIGLWFDGGDAYEPGVVFWAEVGDTVWAHIPPTRELQRQLWKQQDTIDGYLAATLTKPDEWRLLSEAEDGPQLMNPVNTLDDDAGEGDEA